MTDTPDTPASDGPDFPRWLKWGLLGALAVLVVGYGLIFLYAKVLNDSPDELDTSDRDAALAAAAEEEPADDDSADEPPTTTDSGVTTTESPTSTDATSTDATTPTSTTPTSTTPSDDTDAPAGPTWTIADTSELGYRVKEVLFGVDTDAVGRTDQITGGLTIEGTRVTSAEFIVDVASIESDDGRRDGQFRGRIMSTDEFPEATFVLTEPIELGTEPVEGAAVVTEATGDLTLRGVTNSVTFEVDAAVSDGRIGVLGTIPVVFADYEIDNPSFGGVQTEDEGLLEFVLVFEQ